MDRPPRRCQWAPIDHHLWTRKLHHRTPGPLPSFKKGKSIIWLPESNGSALAKETLGGRLSTLKIRFEYKMVPERLG
ncbi:hypothetical protein TNCT_152451 [Trichonephila clavata]|uniref:Uncharacterized protein n=1 Tax=Trichonephila clavata TaxID=2740835 RepID=A0A8X6K8Z8_TRICU|nr:hypothetical protein TNCT_152451 [Trichonephila clavata]